MNEIAEYAEKIEMMLTEQKKENKRLKKVQLIQSCALLVFVLVFAIGIFSINANFKRVTTGVPALVETATESVKDTTEEVQQLLEDIESIDFDNLNRTIENAGKSIDELDIESLNNSVRSLDKVVTRLASFFGL